MKSSAGNSQQTQRRLSWSRVLLAALLITGLSTLGVMTAQRWLSAQSITTSTPWFAPYVDITATPSYPFEQTQAEAYKDIVLSFVVASTTDPCQPAWGGVFNLDQAGASLDLDRRIARLRQEDGNVTVSFGGLLNQELAVACTDHNQLKAAYRAVIDRYGIDTIDLDLENSGLTDIIAAQRRAAVIAELQTEYRANGQQLAVWATIPVSTQGLSQDGTAAVNVLLENGVDLAGTNAMTMNFSESREAGQSMFEAAKSALLEVHRQLGILYERNNIYLSSAALWAKIGATPMAGQNDVADEVFGLDDAQLLNQFAASVGLGRMSMWSANRDQACGDNYTTPEIANDSCSGVVQEDHDFAYRLGSQFEGRTSQSASVVTADDREAGEELVDDPATSPYQIWSLVGTYLQGTKVVWHQNVYEAKWWTQGEIPDNPVLQSWETPWKLIGPVLPGEKPVEQASVPEGTYPEWSGKKIYDAGNRVLFENIPFQSKWWTQGDSPAAASSNPDNSPWVPLTQAQINEVLAES